MPHHRRPDRDRAIGARLCLARTLAGLTRPALAEKLGVGPGQVERYERGAARIAASMLDDLAAALGREPVWFVETDHDVVARAACLQAPSAAVLRRQFERAVNLLSSGRPAQPRREARHVPA